MNDNEMATTIKVVFSDEEKTNIKAVAKKLGLTQSEIVRAGLKKMGCDVEITKDRGAPLGNTNNPDGNPAFGKKYTWKKNKN